MPRKNRSFIVYFYLNFHIVSHYLLKHTYLDNSKIFINNNYDNNYYNMLTYSKHSRVIVF